MREPRQMREDRDRSFTGSIVAEDLLRFHIRFRPDHSGPTDGTEGTECLRSGN